MDEEPMHKIEQIPLTTLRGEVNVIYTDLLRHFFDLSYVASHADKTIVLNGLVKRTFGFDSRESKEEYNERFEANTAFSRKHHDKVARRLKDIKVYYESQKSFFDDVRKIFPSFCVDPEKKMGTDNYAVYRTASIALRNAATLQLPDKEEPSQEERVLETQDKISEVTDNQEFTNACRIADSFLAEELEAFLQFIETLPPEEVEKLKHQKYKVFSFVDGTKVEGRYNTITYAKKMLKEKQEKLVKYAEINALFGKAKKIDHFKFRSSDSEERFYER